MDTIEESQKKIALLEARKLYPDVPTQWISWAYDYVQEVGEEEFLERIRTGYYDKKEKVEN